MLDSLRAGSCLGYMREMRHVSGEEKDWIAMT